MTERIGHALQTRANWEIVGTAITTPVQKAVEIAVDKIKPNPPPATVPSPKFELD
jgi:hypothetical protein